jgi:hypothetical protein
MTHKHTQPGSTKTNFPQIFTKLKPLPILFNLANVTSKSTITNCSPKPTRIFHIWSDLETTFVVLWDRWYVRALCVCVGVKERNGFTMNGRPTDEDLYLYLLFVILEKSRSCYIIWLWPLLSFNCLGATDVYYYVSLGKFLEMPYQTPVLH